MSRADLFQDVSPWYVELRSIKVLKVSRKTVTINFKNENYPDLGPISETTFYMEVLSLKSILSLSCETLLLLMDHNSISFIAQTLKPSACFIYFRMHRHVSSESCNLICSFSPLLCQMLICLYY